MRNREESYPVGDYPEICEGIIAAFWRRHGQPPIMCYDSGGMQTWVQAGGKMNSSARQPSKEEFDAAIREWSARTLLQPEEAVIVNERGNLYIRRRAWKQREAASQHDDPAVLMVAYEAAQLLVATGKQLGAIALRVGAPRKEDETDTELRARAVERFEVQHGVDIEDAADAVRHKSKSDTKQLPQQVPTRDDVQRSVSEAGDTFSSLRERFR